MPGTANETGNRAGGREPRRARLVTAVDFLATPRGNSRAVLDRHGPFLIIESKGETPVAVHDLGQSTLTHAR